MNTLLLQLIGPMQSWGVASNFTYRDTAREPSKSGVVGLLCAALGRPREEQLDDLAELRMGVRADREGLVRRDYHTAGKGGYLKADGQIEKKDVVVTQRYYLADASFLVGLEALTPELLQELHKHLRNPIWPLYLGRKAFVPSEPVWLKDGLKLGQDLLSALGGHERLRPKRTRWDDDRMRVMLEDENGEIVRQDQPLCFVSDARRFGIRRLRATTVDDRPLQRRCVPCTSLA